MLGLTLATGAADIYTCGRKTDDRLACQNGDVYILGVDLMEG